MDFLLAAALGAGYYRSPTLHMKTLIQASKWIAKGHIEPEPKPEFKCRSILLIPMFIITSLLHSRHIYQASALWGKIESARGPPSFAQPVSLYFRQRVVQVQRKKSQLTRGIAKQQLMKRTQTMATKHCGPSNSLISFTRVRRGLCQHPMR